MWAPTTKHAHQLRLPSFLVIGGMKCGSTTLYEDLLSQPGIRIPEKEVSPLVALGSSDADIRQQYAAMFDRARSGRVWGDVSTRYSMLPDLPGVADRARAVLGAELKIIYLVRDPLERLVSHHHHMHSLRGAGHMPADIDRCVREQPSLVNYSRYAMQLRPWREAFGEMAIRIVVFEEYVRNRPGTITDLCHFLGVEPRCDRVSVDVQYNRSVGKPVFNPFWERLSHHAIYRRGVRPWLSSEVRRCIMRRLLPAAPPRPAPPKPDTLDWLREQLRPDVAELEGFLGRSCGWAV
ncbi:MAG TPA: sulfotransferase domain-containing protein [Pirellulaceae bacterium]